MTILESGTLGNSYETELQTSLEQINKKLTATKLENFLIKKYGNTKASNILDKLTNIINTLITIVTIINLFVTATATLLMVTYFSAISVNNNSLINIIYLCACLLVFALGTTYTIVVILILDYLQIHYVCLAPEIKKSLVIKKSELENKISNMHNNAKDVSLLL